MVIRIRFPTVGCCGLGGTQRDYQYRNCSTMPVQLALARSAGREAERHGAPGWSDLAFCGSIWSPDSHLAAQEGFLGAQDGQFGTQIERFGAAADRSVERFGPADDRSGASASISIKSMCSRTSCLDAACLARSASMLHASNLVHYICLVFV